MTVIDSLPSSSGDLDGVLDGLFGNAAETLGDPFPGWRELREHAPVYQHGAAILVSSHKAVLQVLRDKEHFSGRWTSRGTYIDDFRKRLSSEQLPAFEELLRFEQHFMRFNDDPEHARIRGIVQRAFGPRQLGGLRDGIREYCDELIDEWSSSDVVDLMDFAYRLPLHVICEMIGVPRSDQELVHTWSGQFVGALLKQHPEKVLPAHEAMTKWRVYMKDILAMQREQGAGRSFFLTCLFDAIDRNELDDDGAAAMCINMLFGGHEAPTNLVSIGMFEMLRNVDQWNLFCSDPSISASAVEELLRFISPNQWERRIAVTDAELDGVKINANQVVLPILAAANRDPSVFSDPDRLDITRRNASENVAFSFGMHHCLGAGLARLEGRIAFEAFARRYPHTQLENSNPEWTSVGGRRRIASLPVRIS